MNLARFSVNRPVTTGIICVFLFVMGIYYLKQMSVSLYPEVNIPWVSIIVKYPGGSPQQIETKIIKPLENEVAGIKKVDKILGIASNSYAQVWVAFKMSADERESLESVREKVAIIKDKFPEGSREPIIQRLDMGSSPVLVYGIETSIEPREAKKVLEEGLIRQIKRIEGVNEVNVIGVGERKLELQLNADKMRSLRVTPLEIYQSLKTKLAVIPWGDIKYKGLNVTVGRGVFSDDPEYWQKFALTMADGRGIMLSDVGSVKLLDDTDTESVFVNGKRSITLMITKRSDANSLQTIKSIKSHLSSAGIVPPEFKLIPIIDESGYIEANANEVWIALFLGGFFAVIVILFFLTDIRSALISATALPVSVAGSFIFMSYLGFSINMLSLLALSLAIGLLIDDAVVVREAIYSEMEHGKKGAEAAIIGTDKVAAAVLATTLAIVAVFLPVGMMQGLVGQFFKQFGITIVIAVLISLWVAFTLDPMLSAKYAGEPKPLQGKFWDKWREFLKWMENTISKWANFSYKYPMLILVVSILLLGGSAKLAISRGLDFLNVQDKGQFILSIKSPDGTTKEDMEEVAQDAISRLQTLEGIQHVYAKVGGFYPRNYSEIRFIFSGKTDRLSNIVELQRQAREKLQGIKGEFLIEDPPMIEGLPQEPPISFRIYGEDLDELHRIGKIMQDKIQQIPGVANIRVQTDKASPAFDLSIDSTKLGYFGADSSRVELSGRISLTGLEAGSVGTENLPFVVRMQPSDRTFYKILEDTYIPTMRGPQTMGSFMTVKEDTRPFVIERGKRTRSIVLRGTLDRSRSLDFVLKDVQNIAKQVIVPPYFSDMSGDKEMLDEMKNNFTLAILGSIFFIFVLLAAQFEHVFRPLVILLSLPLALIGAFLGLYLANETIALGAFIGIILLIGLSAKNAILLVDAISVRERKMNMHKAVVESVRSRARPILMTSFAMIFGMIPTAIMRGEGSEFRSPMAVAIIGGVITSTLLSFLVIPAIFGLVQKIKRWLYPPKKVIASIFLFGLFNIVSEKAQADLVTPSKIASSSYFISLIKDIKNNSAEQIAITLAKENAELTQKAAWEPFWGGVKLEAGQVWVNPPVKQEINIPLPPALGGPINKSTTLVPASKYMATIGWQLPIFNYQIWRGLKVASAMYAQLPSLQRAKQESATFAYAQSLFQYAMAQEIVNIRNVQIDIEQKRLQSVTDRIKVGTAKKLEQNELKIAVEQAKLALTQAKSDVLKQKTLFEQQTGKKLPDNPIGLPQFPLVLNKKPKSFAIDAIDQAVNVYIATLNTNDSSFYPSVNLESGYSWEDYGKESPDPRLSVALKLQWTPIDGGTRARNKAETMQNVNELKLQQREIMQKLEENYATLQARYTGIINTLASAKSMRTITINSQQVANDSFHSGLATASDVLKADNYLLEAQLVVLQSEFALQAIAMESVYLTGGWLDYINSGNNTHN